MLRFILDIMQYKYKQLSSCLILSEAAPGVTVSHCVGLIKSWEIE